MICRRRDDGYFTVPSAGESRAPVQAFCLPIPRNCRAALTAEVMVYKKGIVNSGPVFREMKRSKYGRLATMLFDHAGAGLVSTTPAVEGFAIQDDQGHWHRAAAKIVYDTVIVTCAKNERIERVRYAWADNPPASLYNKERLPAVPFQTDP